MGTPQHTPSGRGFDDALFFFHHANGYYTSGVELEATGEVSSEALWERKKKSAVSRVCVSR